MAARYWCQRQGAQRHAEKLKYEIKIERKNMPSMLRVIKQLSGRSRGQFVAITTVSLLAMCISMAQASEFQQRRFTLSNGVVTMSVAVDSGKLAAEKLTMTRSWAQEHGGQPITVESNGDYAINIFWTGWSAPGRVNNANNNVFFTEKDFRLVGSERVNRAGGGSELDLYFQGIGLPFQLEVSYRLDSAAFYIHRRISIRDTVSKLHFLRRIWALKTALKGRFKVVKNGGFGQPIALADERGGSGFWGLEYPAGQDRISSNGGSIRVECGEVFGERIGRTWIRSHWSVEGLAPNKYVKLWFMKYVKRIRVAPAEPYTLYNTWYDLRSPRFKGLGKDHIMNQTNIIKIIDLLRKNMIEKHGIRLNAFVLDDGWDKYQSDWKLRKSTFPNGLKPIVDDLKKTNTVLGLWLGPIGGYSFSNLRVDWMKAHGYETVGNELCLGGKNYSQLFKRRVVDFAKDDGVGYYKWDGIQFSCSQPDHGHPVGIYSRDAILDTLINISRAVRKANPKAYLNITSGTWLSPWWVKYANQIWMQGGDFGYADVPSISPRDAAMTYRDLTLYNDFKTYDMWFPIANLMTHGIIKGSLEQLGGKNEPLDRFTNEAVLYFARGVSMWELYVSPGILTSGEWNAISRSILWARNRFPILSNTEMIGGNPGKRQAYGYVHFKGNEGIVAARNPWIKPSALKVDLTPSLGFSSSAKSLVVERVYPDRWISPRLYSTGESFRIPLDGYETAVYEIFPLDSARHPLVAGVHFERSSQENNNYTVDFYDAGRDVRLLNPKIVESGSNLSALHSTLSSLKSSVRPVSIIGRVRTIKGENPRFEFVLNINRSVKKSSLDLLLEPSEGSAKNPLPRVGIEVDGKSESVTQLQSDSKSKWYSIGIEPGRHTVSVRFTKGSAGSGWMGEASIWVLCRQLQRSKSLTFHLKSAAGERPMPPRELPPNETVTNVNILEHNVVLTSGN